MNATAWQLFIAHVRVVIAKALKRKNPSPSLEGLGFIVY